MIWSIVSFITAAHTILNKFLHAVDIPFGQGGVRAMNLTDDMKFWLATSIDNGSRLMRESREDINIVRIFFDGTYDIALVMGKYQRFDNLLYHFSRTNSRISIMSQNGATTGSTSGTFKMKLRQMRGHFFIEPIFATLQQKCIVIQRCTVLEWLFTMLKMSQNPQRSWDHHALTLFCRTLLYKPLL